MQPASLSTAAWLRNGAIALAVASCLIAWLALSGTSAAVDSAVLVALRHPGNTALGIGPAATPALMRFISVFGSTPWLAALTLAATGYIYITGRRRLALTTFGGVAGVMLLAGILKLTAGRPRPEVVSHLGGFTGPSFPSSHAMLGAAVYALLALALGEYCGNNAVRRFLCWMAAAMAGIIGFSRLYLGVHWPTDVLAGWCMGAAWALGFAALRLRGVRRDDAPPHPAS